MQKIFFLILTAFTTSTVVAQTCTLRKDEDGIKVYTCHSDTSQNKIIIVETVLNGTLEKFEKILLNFSSYKTWQYATSESNVLQKINPREYIYYTHINAPWPVSDRDMVIHFDLARTENEIVITNNSIKNILPENKNMVRVPSSHAQYVVKKKNEKELSVRYTMQVDPGGFVPTWLINMVCAQAPYRSFKKLKTLIESMNE